MSDNVKHISEVMAQLASDHGLVPKSKVARIEFDGACGPRNPGGVATAGYRVLLGDVVVYEGSELIKQGSGATNNVAEYAALGKALRKFHDTIRFAVELGVTSLECVGDSKLVISQITGQWKCNKPHLQQLRDRCSQLIRWIEQHGITVSLKCIPREENEAADALSRSAYEEHTGERFPVRQR